MDNVKNVLIIFVKNPRLGQVKTRLEKSVGKAKALSVYKKLLSKTHKTVKELEVDKCVFYADEISPEDIWKEPDFTKSLQKGNDLGERMRHAFQKMFDQSFEHVCLIGSDIYELTPEIIINGFDQLSTFDIVIGPSVDGGYYLIGMKKPYHILFENIDWSTEKVLSQTILKATEAGLSYHMLPDLNDIDELSDIKKEDIKYLLS